jgi:hypothetical protein
LAHIRPFLPMIMRNGRVGLSGAGCGARPWRLVLLCSGELLWLVMRARLPLIRHG